MNKVGASLAALGIVGFAEAADGAQGFELTQQHLLQIGRVEDGPLHGAVGLQKFCGVVGNGDDLLEFFTLCVENMGDSGLLQSDGF